MTSIALCLLLITSSGFLGAEPPAEESPISTAAPPTQPRPEPLFTPVNLAVGGAFLFYVLVHLAWVFVFRPLVRRRPLNRALAILVARDESHFPEADLKLSKVLTVGLGRKDIVRARIALGFVRARMKKYDEAVAETAELMKAPNPNREAVYLHMWLLAKLKKYRDVEATFDQHGGRLTGYLDSNMIVGVSLLRRAMEHRRNRHIDGAMACFRKLETLKILVDEIPRDIEDEKTVLGVLSLFDPNPEEARRQFEDAVVALEAAGRETLHPRIGLLLCRWIVRKSPADWGVGEDNQLGELVSAISNRAPAIVTMSLGVNGNELPRKPTGIAEDELKPDSLLLRNVRLWYAISLLNTWLNLPPKSLQAAFASVTASGNALGQERAGELKRRLAAVAKVDEAMPDPHLIIGMIAYYFGGESTQKRGLVALEKALAAGVNTPEVILLVNREKKRAEMEKNRPELLFVAAKRYLANQEIPVESRRSVLNDLRARWSRFKTLDEADLTRGMDESPVSVRSLVQASREQMDGWLKRLPSAADPERVAKVKAQIDGLKSTADEASKMLGGMADVQGKILVLLAESMFPEEQPVTEARQIASPLRTESVSASVRLREPKPQVTTSRVGCPSCNAAFKVSAEAVGKRATCPKCKIGFVIKPV